MNTEFGIYGNITNISKLNIGSSNELEVARREEIKKGNAKVLLNLENGIRKEYNIEIEKIYKNNNSNNKSMLIKVTDQELLNLTGGIVQRYEWSTNYTEQKIKTVMIEKPPTEFCNLTHMLHTKLTELMQFKIQ